MSSIRGEARGEEEPKPLKKREIEEKRRKHACIRI